KMRSRRDGHRIIAHECLLMCVVDDCQRPYELGDACIPGCTHSRILLAEHASRVIPPPAIEVVVGKADHGRRVPGRFRVERIGWPELLWRAIDHRPMVGELFEGLAELTPRLTHPGSCRRAVPPGGDFGE